jgi:NhaP-type Na+/H+ or K+/H+ antiporter
LVFALLALEELGEAQMEEAVVIIALTVFLSVIAHGASAAPLASRYGAAASTRGPEPSGSVPDVPIRGLPRRDGGGAAHNHDP